MSLGDLPEKIFSLITSVDRLARDVDKLDDVLRKHADRITRLENGQELTIEKAKVAVFESQTETYARIFQQLAEVQSTLGSLHPPVPEFKQVTGKP